MRSVGLVAIGALCAFAFVQSSLGADKDARFKVPRETIVEKVKTIAIMPARVADGVPDAEGVALRYEAQIASRVEGAGFTVIPASAMREIRERLKKTLGGLYDPMTGEANKDKVKAFYEYARNEFASGYKPDATLRIGILERRASITGHLAQWDGVSENTSGRSGLASFLFDTDAEGSSPALSLVITLEDTKGDMMYAAFGGLQVLSYMRSTGLYPKPVHVDRKYIMTDPARDARALALALGPLIGNTDPAAAAKIAVGPVEVPDSAPALKIPREELLGQYGKVALAPLAIAEISQHVEVQARYRQALEKSLGELGLTVTGGDSYAQLWEAERTAAGGFFDPFTGRRDEDRMRSSRIRVFAKLREQFGITAVVYPSVVLTSAAFKQGTAKWDGVSESITTTKGLGKLFDPGTGFMGELSALSLEIRIADGDDRTLFDESGGIQVIERYSGGRLSDVPESDLFADATRDSRAIEVALRPLKATPDAKK
jgi:hypothetical protein